jgi:hypothetical protein
MKNKIKEELKRLVLYQKGLKLQKQLLSYMITELTLKISKKESAPLDYQVFDFQKVKLMAHRLSLILQRHNISTVQRYLKANSKRIQELESSLRSE